MNYWNQFPLFRLILPFVLGIISAIFYQREFPLLGETLIALFALTIILALSRKFNLKYKYRWLFGLLINLTFFLSGYQLTIAKTGKFIPNHFNSSLTTDLSSGRESSLSRTDGRGGGAAGVQVIVNIVEPVHEKQRSIKAIVEVVAVNKRENWLKTQGKAIVYFEKDTLSKQLKYGDCLLLNTEFAQLQPAQNPSEFNYKRYLSFHSIYYQGYIRSGDWSVLSKDGGNTILRYANSLRKKLLNIFRENNIEGEEFAVASALILGYKDELDIELKRAYASAGAMHVLAVSGLHVGIIYLIFNSLLSFLNKFKYGNIIKAVLLILFLWFYAVLTGLSPSVMRAATMFSFIIVGKGLHRYTNIYNTLAVSAFLLLLINPYLIVEVGFQLSYLAVTGIVLIQPRIYHLWETDNWLLDKIWAIITISIAAQIATFPLALLYFHQFPNYFIFSNLIVIPMAVVIIYLGIGIFLSSPLSWLSGILAMVLNGVIVFLNSCVKFIEQLPYSITQGISISILETWFIYLMIGYLLTFFMINHVRYLKYGLALIIILLGFQVVEGYKEANQRKLIVYNVSKTSAYDFIDGRVHLLLTDSSLINDENKLLFHIRHNWWDMGIKNENMVDIQQMSMVAEQGNLFIKDNLLQFYDKRLVLIKESLPRNWRATKIKVDYAILSKNVKLNIADLLTIYDVSSIIIDSSNSLRKTKKWLEEAEELGIDCYSVREFGAFQVDV